MTEIFSIFAEMFGRMAEGIAALGVSAGEAVVIILLVAVMVLFFRGRDTSLKSRAEFAKNVKTITDYVQGLEASTRMLLKSEIGSAMHTARKQSEGKSEKLDIADIVAPLTRQADAHLKQSAEHRDEIGERIARANEERMNRIETRIEGVGELVKKERSGGDSGGAVHDKIEQQAMYLHDEFAAIAAKIDLLAKPAAADEQSPSPELPEALTQTIQQLDAKIDLLAKSAADGQPSATEPPEMLTQTIQRLDAKIDLLARTGGGGGSGGGGGAGVDPRLPEMLAQSIHRLGVEMNAKLTLLNDKLERQMESRWSDALVSLASLRDRIEELAGAGEKMDSRRDMSPFSPLMYAHADEEKDGARQLSEILPQVLPIENFTLNAELPGGRRADALVRFPDPRDSIAIDAGFTPPHAGSGGEYDAKRAFADALAARIAHVADNLIVPPHTGENALLFISSEAVFAEIHSHHRDAVKLAQSRGVWLTSPATLPAVIGAVNTAVRDHHARRRLRELRETVAQIVEEARHFENRLTEIGDHVNSAWRSVQRAENAGGRLIGGIRDMSRAAREPETSRFPVKHDSDSA